ncbi:MAG: hypothetical protein WA647_19075 [Candidatus Acidiferrum sp.]
MSEPHYRELENKTRRQHYVTLMVEHIAGRTAGEIAASLGMTEKSVLRDLKYADVMWDRVRPRAGGDGVTKATQPSFPNLMVQSECADCGAIIATGQERTSVAVIEYGHDVDDYDAGYKKNGVAIAAGGVDTSDIARLAVTHYCEGCSEKLAEFHVKNPTASRRSAPAALVANDGDQSEKARAAEANPIAPPDVSIASATSSEIETRKVLDAFLKNPRSRGIRQEMRDAATWWLEGHSQNDIARKLKKNQATVCRMLTSAKQQAYASR